jgi:hypothetical protein
MMQIALGKTEPAVAIKLVRLFKVMLEQIQNHDLPAALQNLVSGGNRVLGIFRVMQRLAQHDQVHAVRLNRRALKVTKTKLEILQSVLFGLRFANLRLRPNLQRPVAAKYAGANARTPATSVPAHKSGQSARQFD